jgi:hypothetical protein
MIQCAGCGTVVGVMPYGMLKKIFEELGSHILGENRKVGTMLADGLNHIVRDVGDVQSSIDAIQDHLKIARSTDSDSSIPG